ncbi:MAG: hypothetical protein HFH11_10275 [Dorea sp.]|jgi:hypothetical protein|nr:hypothetical protein [Clostridiales bacterium]MCI9271516.1 hypothetical protein [Dorea sp.]
MIEIQKFSIVSSYGENIIDLIDRLCCKRIANDDNQKLYVSKNKFSQFRWINPCAYLGLKAVDNMGLHPNISNHSEWGVYCGTAFGGMPLTQVNLCEALLQEGHPGITIAHTIHSGYQFATEAIANMYSIAGPNLTVCDGVISSGIALWQAYNDIISQIIQNAIVVGCEWIDQNLMHVLVRTKNTTFLCSAASSVLLKYSNAPDMHDKSNRVWVRSCSFISSGMKYSDDELNALIIKEVQKTGLRLNDINLIISSGSDFNQEGEDIVHLRDQSINFIKIEDYYGHMLGAAYIFSVAIASGLIQSKNNHYRNILILGSDGNKRLIITILSSKAANIDNG